LIRELLADEEFIQMFAEKQAQAAAQAAAQRDVLAVLETRFGEVPRDLADEIRSVADEDRLADLIRKAASCGDLETFGKEIKR
jgi:hypothetical protein